MIQKKLRYAAFNEAASSLCTRGFKFHLWIHSGIQISCDCVVTWVNMQKQKNP